MAKSAALAGSAPSQRFHQRSAEHLEADDRREPLKLITHRLKPERKVVERYRQDVIASHAFDSTVVVETIGEAHGLD